MRLRRAWGWLQCAAGACPWLSSMMGSHPSPHPHPPTHTHSFPPIRSGSFWSSWAMTQKLIWTPASASPTATATTRTPRRAGRGVLLGGAALAGGPSGQPDASACCRHTASAAGAARPARALTSTHGPTPTPPLHPGSMHRSSPSSRGSRWAACRAAWWTSSAACMRRWVARRLLSGVECPQSRGVPTRAQMRRAGALAGTRQPAAAAAAAAPPRLARRSPPTLVLRSPAAWARAPQHTAAELRPV